MSSVNLTSSMYSCLNALKMTTSSMDTVNERLSTGLKVNSALDDPLSYFAAEDHTSDAEALSTINDDMNEAIQTIEAASDGIEAILDLLDDMKALCNSALSAEDSAEAESYLKQVNDLMDQIDYVADDSEYAGINLLGGTTEELIVYLNEDNSNQTKIEGVDASYEGLGMASQASGNFWDATDTDAEVPNDSNIEDVISAITTAKSTLRSDAKSLSTDLSLISTRQEFTENRITVLETGASNLVSADLNEESANLLALQTQQSLGTNSLSIASQSMQSVLNLF